MYEGIVSVDLGRQVDFTAVLVAEEAVWVGEPPTLAAWEDRGPRVEQAALWPGAGLTWVPPSALNARQRAFFRARTISGIRPSRPPLLVRHIERVRGRPYPQIIAEIGALLRRPPLAELNVTVLMDCGGVGVAVSDYAWQAGIGHVSITATAGDRVNVSDGGRTIHCPKRELVSAGQIMLAEGRIRISAGLPHAATLVRELEGYRVTISAAGHDSYSARENEHDDLTYALCQMAWYRDWHSQPHDDAIAARQRRPAAFVN